MTNGNNKQKQTSAKQETVHVLQLTTKPSLATLVLLGMLDRVFSDRSCQQLQIKIAAVLPPERLQIFTF